MIITLEPDANREQMLSTIQTLVRRFQGIEVRDYAFQGASHRVVEIHLVGETQHVPTESFASLPGVRSVVRVAAKYRIIGRPVGNSEPAGFVYNGVRIGGDEVAVFAGLCAVDTCEHVAEMMRALAEHGVTTTRMGVYKPRTSPYDFQGLGKDCLPWLFELAGKHGIRIIALEVCDGRHVDEVLTALEQSGNATGVMLQIGSRNAQNFELLKRVGQQQVLPVLHKRGMGLSLEESLNACEYVASEGNLNIVLGLRGVKTHLGEPHRNLVDFIHVPVVHRLTRLPVCIDPSHPIGSNKRGLDGLPEIFHAVGQGVIAGADMVLVEFHPNPPQARCDGHQALELRQLPKLLEYVGRVRRTYQELVALGA